MGHYNERVKRAIEKEKNVPQYIKDYVNNIIKDMDDTQEIKEHLKYIDELETSLNKHRERLEIIRKDVTAGEMKWLELREYRNAIELMLIDLRTTIYYLEDKNIDKSRPHGKIRIIFEGRGLLELQLLKAVREMDKYINAISRSNNNSRIYYRYCYYDKKNNHKINRVSESRRINNEK